MPSLKHILTAIAATLAGLGLAVASAASAAAAPPPTLHLSIPAATTTGQPVPVVVTATQPDGSAGSSGTVNIRLVVPSVPAYGHVLGSVPVVSDRAEMVVPAHSLPAGEDEIVATWAGGTARAYVQVWQRTTIQTLSAVQIGPGQMRVELQVTAGAYAPQGFVQLESVAPTDLAGAIPVPGRGVFSVEVPVPPAHCVTAVFVPAKGSHELPARRTAAVRPRPTGGIVSPMPQPPFTSGFPVPPPTQRAAP